MTTKSGDMTKKELAVKNAMELSKKANEIFKLRADNEVKYKKIADYENCILSERNKICYQQEQIDTLQAKLDELAHVIKVALRIYEEDELQNRASLMAMQLRKAALMPTPETLTKGETK